MRGQGGANHAQCETDALRALLDERERTISRLDGLLRGHPHR